MATPHQTQPHEGDNDASTERSPLLGRHQAGHNDTTVGNGAVVEPENAQPISDGAGDDDQEIALADEPSTKKLIAIMGSLWLGVFFAALGTLIALFPYTSKRPTFESE
jgi:hypothetical protein